MRIDCPVPMRLEYGWADGNSRSPHPMVVCARNNKRQNYIRANVGLHKIRWHAVPIPGRCPGRWQNNVGSCSASTPTLQESSIISLISSVLVSWLSASPTTASELVSPGIVPLRSMGLLSNFQNHDSSYLLLQSVTALLVTASAYGLYRGYQVRSMFQSLKKQGIVSIFILRNYRVPHQTQ